MRDPLIPEGEERQVQTIGGAAIDGAPVAYIVVLAAVVTALSFIPFSIVLASGGSMPLSQSIYPLLGWVLGPIAGALASGIGSLIGVFLAPYTAGVPGVTVWGAVIGSLTAGAMVLGTKRKFWYLILTALFVVELLLYSQHALRNGVALRTIILGSFVNWSGLLLFVFPTRTLAARWIKNQNLGRVAAGLFLGTWMVWGVTHLSQTVITYFMFNWPEKIWILLIPTIPFENLIRCVAAAIIGTGVISGLRAINLVKPKQALY